MPDIGASSFPFGRVAWAIITESPRRLAGAARATRWLLLRPHLNGRACLARRSEQIELRLGAGRFEAAGVQRTPAVSVQTEPPASNREAALEQLREQTLATHARPEVTVVFPPATHTTHPAHHVRGLQREVVGEP